jgi:hypothetical protein
MSFDISPLTASEALWDLVSVWLSIAVAIGVSLEAVTEFATLAGWLHLDTQERFALRHGIAKAGLLLLITALAFEVVSAIRTHEINQLIISGLNGEISDTQDREQALIRETTALRVDNAKLKSSISEQEGTLRSLGERTDEFEKTANTLRSRTAASLTRLKKYEITLESAQRAASASSGKAANAAATARQTAAAMATALDAEKAMQIQMRELITPRVLPPEQIETLKTTLKQYVSTPFDFVVADDQDAKTLLMQVGTMLLDSGWIWKPAPTLSGFTINFDNGYHAAEASTDGLHIEIAESQRSQLGSPAVDLLRCLLSAGIRANLAYVPDEKVNVAFDKKVLHVIIGKR